MVCVASPGSGMPVLIQAWNTQAHIQGNSQQILLPRHTAMTSIYVIIYNTHTDTQKDAGFQINAVGPYLGAHSPFTYPNVSLRVRVMNHLRTV